MSKVCADCGGGFEHYVKRATRCGACAFHYWTAMKAANKIVCRARRVGDVPDISGPCADCGAPAQVYDHRDYRKPLELTPVCRKCNARRGAALYDKRLGVQDDPQPAKAAA